MEQSLDIKPLLNSMAMCGGRGGKRKRNSPGSRIFFFGNKSGNYPCRSFLGRLRTKLGISGYLWKCQVEDWRKIIFSRKEKTPEYYQDQQYYAWFKFTRIEPCDEAQLKEFTYVNCPSLFLDKNVDYSKFTNKKVYSITELVQQNRTVWFVRTALDTDLDNEIILLNSESIQPAYFNAKYYQASGNTLLWLSDLHLSDNRFESKKGGFKRP